MTVVGIIPARGGSKRLPGKNLAELGGRPLIAHTCEAAVQSGVLKAVYVNTDCQVIAAAAAEYDVSCPVLRPAELATDEATTLAANHFLLEYLAGRGERYDAVMVLQPTSPLRSAADIVAAWQLFEENAPCKVVSVSPVAPAAWLGHIGKDGRFEPLDGGEEIMVRLNGAIYIHTWDDYFADHTPARTLAYPMPAERGVDIDTEEDLHHAAFILARSE